MLLYGYDATLLNEHLAPVLSTTSAFPPRVQEDRMTLARGVV